MINGPGDVGSDILKGVQNLDTGVGAIVMLKFEDFTLPHIFQVDSTGVQAHFADSRWTPGAFYFGGSPAKFMCIIHLEFT